MLVTSHRGLVSSTYKLEPQSGHPSSLGDSLTTGFHFYFFSRNMSSCDVSNSTHESVSSCISRSGKATSWGKQPSGSTLPCWPAGRIGPWFLIKPTDYFSVPLTRYSLSQTGLNRFFTGEVSLINSQTRIIDRSSETDQ